MLVNFVYQFIDDFFMKFKILNFFILNMIVQKNKKFVIGFLMFKVFFCCDIDMVLINYVSNYDKIGVL